VRQDEGRARLDIVERSSASDVMLDASGAEAHRQASVAGGVPGPAVKVTDNRGPVFGAVWVPNT